MTYKRLLFVKDGTAATDVNAQPDLILMTFLLDADVFVTNENGFARRAFDDLWRTRGKVLLTSEQIVDFIKRM